MTARPAPVMAASAVLTACSAWTDPPISVAFLAAGLVLFALGARLMWRAPRAAARHGRGGRR